MKLSPDVRSVLQDGAGQGIAAIERALQRRRDDACVERMAMARRLDRLPKVRWLARILTRRRWNVANDYCKVPE